MNGEFDHLIKITAEEFYGSEIGHHMWKIGVRGFIPIELHPDLLADIAARRGFDVTTLLPFEKTGVSNLVIRNLDTNETLVMDMKQVDGRSVAYVDNKSIPILRRMFSPSANEDMEGSIG